MPGGRSGAASSAEGCGVASDGLQGQTFVPGPELEE